MLRKLGLQQSLSSERKNVITFNVGGQKITNQRTTFTPVSNSTFDTIVPTTKMMNFNNESDVFVDYHPKLFQHLINQLRKSSFKSISYPDLSLHEEKVSFRKMLNDLSIHRKLNMIYINDVYRSFFISRNSSHNAYRRNRFFTKIIIIDHFENAIVIDSKINYRISSYVNELWKKFSSRFSHIYLIKLLLS